MAKQNFFTLMIEFSFAFVGNDLLSSGFSLGFLHSNISTLLEKYHDSNSNFAVTTLIHSHRKEPASCTTK